MSAISEISTSERRVVGRDWIPAQSVLMKAKLQSKRALWLFHLSEAFEKNEIAVKKSAIRGFSMSHELINLTLPVVVKKNWKYLRGLSWISVSSSLSLPEGKGGYLPMYRLTLTAIQLRKRIKNRFSTPSSVQERIRMENLIHGELHILRENAEWVGCQITQSSQSNRGEWLWMHTHFTPLTACK